MSDFKFCHGYALRDSGWRVSGFTASLPSWNFQVSRADTSAFSSRRFSWDGIISKAM